MVWRANGYMACPACCIVAGMSPITITILETQGKEAVMGSGVGCIGLTCLLHGGCPSSYWLRGMACLCAC